MRVMLSADRSRGDVEPPPDRMAGLGIGMARDGLAPTTGSSERS